MRIAYMKGMNTMLQFGFGHFTCDISWFFIFFVCARAVRIGFKLRIFKRNEITHTKTHAY